MGGVCGGLVDCMDEEIAMQMPIIPSPGLDARTIKTSFYLIVGAIFELMTFGL
jgi:hypothetical protein